MVSIHKNQRGVGTLEAILIIVIVGIIGGVGWYVYHSKQNSDKALDQATSTSQNAGPRFKSKTDDKSKTNPSSSNSSQKSNSASSSSSTSNKAETGDDKGSN